MEHNFEELDKIARQCSSKIAEIFPNASVSYNTLTKDYTIISAPVPVESYMLEAYIDTSGKVSIERNDAGSDGDQEKLESILHDWARRIRELGDQDHA